MEHALGGSERQRKVARLLETAARGVASQRETRSQVVGDALKPGEGKSRLAMLSRWQQHRHPQRNFPAVDFLALLEAHPSWSDALRLSSPRTGGDCFAHRIVFGVPCLRWLKLHLCGLLRRPHAHLKWMKPCGCCLETAGQSPVPTKISFAATDGAGR